MHALLRCWGGRQVEVCQTDLAAGAKMLERTFQVPKLFITAAFKCAALRHEVAMHKHQRLVDVASGCRTDEHLACSSEGR